MSAIGAIRLSYSSHEPAYLRYWGKTHNRPGAPVPYHLLAYHCLDVAACGWALLRIERFSLRTLAHELGWSAETLEGMFLVLLAQHDSGKYARAFQGLAPSLSPDLVPPDKKKLYGPRHDTLGWLLLEELRDRNKLDLGGRRDFWQDLFRVV